jgi:hypothetical protein
MESIRTATIVATAVVVSCVGWAVLAWETGFGIELFMAPGGYIADIVFPQKLGVPFEAKGANSVAEAMAQFVVARGLQRALEVWWCAVVFWLSIPPAAAFFGALRVRRRGA